MAPKSEKNFTEQQVAALLASIMKKSNTPLTIDFTTMSAFLNGNENAPTPSSLEHRFRSVKAIAKAMIEKPPSGPAAISKKGSTLGKTQKRAKIDDNNEDDEETPSKKMKKLKREPDSADEDI